MSLRERVLIVLGVIAVAATVIIPVAHRLNTEVFGSGGTAVGAPPTAGPATQTPVVAPAPTSPLPTRSPTTPAPLVRFAWTAEAIEHRHEIGATFGYACPPNGVAAQIWGTLTYTDDSPVCTAAVHRGVITLRAGGDVTIVMRPGLQSYRGSVANGVTSDSYEAWPGSYEIVVP